ncbi:hypothetical protein OG393_30970 [Streptomyces sp. NBC_01216]|uniref:hypothetical protein n=1 Tax=Streptomyces sp. NBC_01216 TaxID=2903778 RepID=UPI002E11F23F|nr:hypothetical protein OG393_30970 [Streptomyces sp. NBC_01216]
MSDTRVVLLKPGDLLLIGNVGSLGDDDAILEAAKISQALKEKLGLGGLVMFEGDINLDAAKGPRA